ncbi:MULTISPECIES: septum site-determining protein MinC [unclassified Paenibacillus]|uniref:septum site-determining protein MinC n=1 Tax=unclassified Paenibacillus TaxID=185978 RepID=UPI001C119A9D|nr:MULTISPECIES: septum site-determining protein MinC [unclassified Paenibacillus]MBU5444666.1 septum site-determining protein MinC [Paenibacillus sp. MSJ-34]CAH0119126.1 Septum site-determining protein MinC [Paenibacillus sp. CECT 9249]
MRTKHRVTIKGIKDGLVFLLDDQCEFSELLEELKYKLEHSHQNILTGPIMHVDVKCGSREMSENQREEIINILKQKGNLLIRSVESDAAAPAEDSGDRITIMTGMVRSGQVMHHDGHLLFLGDVNPGGTVTCTGDIYIMGKLRGMAHAGYNGNEDAIIAASQLTPTQLRIADVISRPPDEWGDADSNMEFAYLKDGAMEIDKLTNITRLRRNSQLFKGV